GGQPTGGYFCPAPLATHGRRRVADDLVQVSDAGGRDVVVIVERAVGHDIDDATGRVGSGQRGRSALDHFDLPDVVDVDREIVPDCPGIIVDEYLAAIDQHQQARLKSRLIAAHADIE